MTLCFNKTKKPNCGGPWVSPKGLEYVHPKALIPESIGEGK